MFTWLYKIYKWFHTIRLESKDSYISEATLNNIRYNSGKSGDDK